MRVLAFLALLLAGCAAPTQAPAPPAPSHDTEYPIDGNLFSAVWGLWDPPAGEPKTGWNGPTMRVGETDRLVLTIESRGGRDLPDWRVEVRIPEGFRLVEGRTEWQGIPGDGLEARVDVEAVREGVWSIETLVNGYAPHWGTVRHKVVDG